MVHGDLVAVKVSWLEDIGAIFDKEIDGYIYCFIDRWDYARYGWYAILTVPLVNNRWGGRILLCDENKDKDNWYLVSKMEKKDECFPSTSKDV